MMNYFSRTKLVAALGALALVSVVGTVMVRRADAQQSNFMGGAPEVLDRAAMGDVAALRLRFPAGVRSNWHTHTDGQLLMVESGHGLHQVRGGPIEMKGPGEPWWTPAGVEHWHGAAPNEDVVQWTFYSGSVDWMDPVTDDQYHLP
ncbi:MAG: cupin domain-containing protein [Gemmatimonadota bacterium]|jgi:quercetin dioxygenase-like cupin family protein